MAAILAAKITHPQVQIPPLKAIAYQRGDPVKGLRVHRFERLPEPH